MAQSIIQVDAFTNESFAGNPAAVCLMNQAADEEWMQQVAAEMNLSETAFLYPVENGYHLRWFTPTAEVELCGHATLASAHVLFEDGHQPTDKAIRFQTLSGELTATKRGEWIELCFPANRPEIIVPPDDLVKAVGRGIVVCAKEERWYLVELESEQAVRKLSCDLAAIVRLPGGRLIVTARSSQPDLDFVSRFFAPGIGIAEDPVTGSAHTVLGPYWAERLGKNEFLAYQASARGGYVKVRVEGDRVYLGGQAVTVMRGELI